MRATKTIRIMMADDHPLFRFGLRKFLEAQPDMEVVGEAADGTAVMPEMQKCQPDVLLLDLAMPRRAGMDTLRELMEKRATVHIIMLTAAIEKEQIAEALQLGARGVVLKDAATEALLSAIRAVSEGGFWVGRDRVANLVEALRELLGAAAGTGARVKGYGLTPRELEVVAAIVRGCTNKEIAEQFNITEVTVKHHLSSIFDKTGVSSRLELAMFALQKNLVRGL